jgi:uncharacterized protein (DUF697 family)/GTP-binding protein EngB required for normal cell division
MQDVGQKYMSTKLEADLVRIIDEKLHDALKKRGRVNVLVAGKTGVGKSTLINAVFQGDLATTGQGRPVTQNTREIKKEGIPVSIFDTRGLELEKFQETLKELTSFLDSRAQMDDPNEHIHCAWICVTEDGRRIEDAEINLCKSLSPRMPVVIVITKARADQGFRSEVQTLLPDASNVVRVRAIREALDEGHTLEPIGLKELVDLTMEIVPQGQKNAFAAAQKVVLRQKQDRAHLIVASAATAAAGVGAAPIPFADAFLLVPIQISMLSGVTAVFGLPLSTSFLTTLVSSTLAGAAGTIGGRAVVSGLLLLIPGAGPILKGVISGSTGAIFTTAFGEAYIAALSALVEKDPNNPPTAEQIAEQLKTELAKRNPFGKK